LSFHNYYGGAGRMCPMATQQLISNIQSSKAKTSYTPSNQI